MGDLFDLGGDRFAFRTPRRVAVDHQQRRVGPFRGFEGGEEGSFAIDFQLCVSWEAGWGSVRVEKRSEDGDGEEMGRTL